MNGPIQMYRTRQIVNHDFVVELPKCMYTLKNIHSIKNGMVDNSADHVSLKTKKLDIFEQVKQFLKNNQQIPGMAELEAKQEDILKQLAELKKQVLSIKSNLKISPCASQSSIINHTSTSSQTSTNDYSDIVINACPTNPPFSLEIIQKMLRDFVSLTFTSHLHSTVTSMPENTQTLEKSLISFTPKPGVPKLNVRLIWKNVGPNTELLISHIPIIGESNVLRYLSRAVTTPLSYGSNPDSVDIDSLLDVAYLIVQARTKTERAGLLQTLNKSLGKSQWLLGRTTPSVADIAAYSAIKQVSNSNEISANLGKWFQKFETIC